MMKASPCNILAYSDLINSGLVLQYCETHKLRLAGCGHGCNADGIPRCPIGLIEETAERAIAGIRTAAGSSAPPKRDPVSWQNVVAALTEIPSIYYHLPDGENFSRIEVTRNLAIKIAEALSVHDICTPPPSDT